MKIELELYYILKKRLVEVFIDGWPPLISKMALYTLNFKFYKILLSLFHFLNFGVYSPYDM